MMGATRKKTITKLTRRKRTRIKEKVKKNNYVAVTAKEEKKNLQGNVKPKISPKYHFNGPSSMLHWSFFSYSLKHRSFLGFSVISSIPYPNNIFPQSLLGLPCVVQAVGAYLVQRVILLKP